MLAYNFKQFGIQLLHRHVSENWDQLSFKPPTTFYRSAAITRNVNRSMCKYTPLSSRTVLWFVGLVVVVLCGAAVARFFFKLLIRKNRNSQIVPNFFSKMTSNIFTFVLVIRSEIITFWSFFFHVHFEILPRGVWLSRATFVLISLGTGWRSELASYIISWNAVASIFWSVIGYQEIASRNVWMSLS